MNRVRRWADLTPDQKKRRMAWTRGIEILDVGGPSVSPDPEAQRIASEIRARVRAQRLAEGRMTA